jgi:hypothetical protein
MSRQRIVHASFDHLVGLVYRDQAALDDPSLPMPGGWTYAAAATNPSWMLGDLARDIAAEGGASNDFVIYSVSIHLRACC